MLKILQLFLYFMASNFLCTNYFFVNSFFEGSWFCIHCCLLIFHISIFSKIIGPITTKLGRWYFQRLNFFKPIGNSSCKIFFKWQSFSKEFQNFMFITYINHMSNIYSLVYYYLSSVKLYFKLKNYCWFYSLFFQWLYLIA